MGRLITFGCSLTYGTGLDPDRKTSAWPFVLGKLLDKSVLNFGFAGVSNKQIYLNVLKYKRYKPGDTVVISWTHNPRHSILLDYKNINQNKVLYPALISKKDESYVYFTHIQNDTDDLIMNYTYMNHVSIYLQGLGCNVVQLVQIPDYDWRNKNYSIDSWNSVANNIPKIYMSMLRKNYGVGTDGWHPNSDCHKKYAELIYNGVKQWQM